ncbi:MAG: PPC domain-containing protein, partial [Arenimonas sp.]
MNAQFRACRATAGPLRGFRRRMAPVVAGFLATMVAMPGAATTFPADPLQSGTPFPPANIMFILDDSGSMDYTRLPDNPVAVTPNDISLLAYTQNSLSYNPNTNYLAWIQATTANTFVRLTGGTDYLDAFSDLEYVDDGINTSGQIDLSSGIQTFYVPKTTGLDNTLTASYYRYQILRTGQVIRSDWANSGATGQTIVINALPATLLTGSTARNTWWSGTTGGTAPNTYSVDVPAGVSNLTVTISGGDADADLYVRRTSLPTTGTGRCPGSDTDSNEVCSTNNPTAGTYYIGVRAANNSGSDSFSNVTLSATYTIDEGCTGSGTTWRNCTQVTPTGRSEPDELTNYATWYSYHRSRVKAAKAGAAEAFSKLGSSLRVGFDSIWNRNPPSDIDSSVGTTPRYPIPVA